MLIPQLKILDLQRGLWRSVNTTTHGCGPKGGTVLIAPSLLPICSQGHSEELIWVNLMELPWLYQGFCRFWSCCQSLCLPRRLSEIGVLCHGHPQMQVVAPRLRVPLLEVLLLQVPCLL